MNNSFLCVGLAVGLAIALAVPGRLAAQSPPPVPQPPLVLPMPENVHVEIAVQETKKTVKGATVPADSAKTIDITKTGATRKVVVTTWQGVAKEYWIVEGFIFTMSPDGKQVNRDVYSPASSFPPYLRTDSGAFYGVEGVSMEQYKGVSPFNGKPCFYYTKVPPAKPAGQSQAAEIHEMGADPVLTPFSGGTKVWIDATTKLPVAAALPEGLCTYTFLPTPQQPLVPPPAIAKYSAYIKDMTIRMQKDAASPPPVPQPPLVLPMPENVHFEIAVQEAKKPGAESPDSVPAPADSAKTIDITKTGTTRKVVVTTRQGIAKEYWIVEGFIFTMSPDGKQVNRDVYSPASSFPPYLRTDNGPFYGVESVSMEQYQGVSPFNGKPCFYYTKVPPAKPSSQVQPTDIHEVRDPVFSPFAGGTKVWIDVKTKLPVAAALPEGLCTYTFLPTPEQPLAPPPDIAKYSAYIKAMTIRMQKEAAVR